MKMDAEAKLVVATNRKARMNYDILETYEAGLSLLGCEVKSLRGGRATLDGCFGRLDGGNVFLFNFYIPPYQFTTTDPPDPRRSRKLLMHRSEIDKISNKLTLKGLTLVPLDIYFRRGWAKVTLGVAKGKKGPDRRDELKKRDQDRDTRRVVRGR